jgi:anti-sigma28 factor (negative regulator of flagellin synthesis)
MKIDPRPLDTPVGAAQVSESASTSAGSQSKRGGSSGFGAGDSVELSGPSRVLQTFASDRAARIERLTQSVRSGTYSVNAQKVSRALVQETLAGAGQ